MRVREVRLEGESERTANEQSRVVSGKHRNTELILITWLFVGVFLVLTGYLIYLNTVKRNALIHHVYNTKQDASSDNVIRGDIITENGQQLAYTSVDYTGNEWRNYPYYSAFAHVVGYASNGKSGLEAVANNQLMTAHSSLLNQLKNASDGEKVKGDSVVVTLKPSLQQAAFYALGSYKGAVVVLEPDSGKILAMVSKPDFDPNALSYEWDQLVSDENNSSLLNRATQGLYPPGSTFKILTALAYLQEHNDYYDDFLFDCEGLTTKEDVTITCYNSHVHGQETLKTAFANSCNTAFASIGLELDNNRFRSLTERFLFNKALPIELPYNQSIFKLGRDSSYGEQMTTAIGQGDTLVTPLHMAMITSAVANAGTLMKPYCIARIETADGSVVSETKPEIYDQLMSVEEAQALTSFMKETVTSGTGNALSYNSYTVAGKTGSAEYETNGSTGTHSWFVGFSNVDDPDIVVAVIAEDGGTGSSTAVPIAQKIFDAYYYG